MRIKEKISIMWQKLKNKFSEDDSCAGAVDPASQPDGYTQFIIPAGSCCDEQPSRSADAPDADVAAPGQEIPSRMTEEYRQWLRQQREARDAESSTEQPEN